MGALHLRMVSLQIQMIQKIPKAFIALLASNLEPYCFKRDDSKSQPMESSHHLILITTIGIFEILAGMACCNILATNQRPISAPPEGDSLSSCK
jgi:hypothetical protein